MSLIQLNSFSSTDTPYNGVIPQPYVSSLGGETYKYTAAKGGRSRTKKAKQNKRTKKAKQNKRSRKNAK